MEKTEVRNVPILYIETKSDDTARATKGEFRAMLDFAMPWNGKKKRLFRMRLSPTDIAYLRERLDLAEGIIREKFNSSFK